ncbi:hypothetical protein [Pedobacter sp. BMA]|uniref:hypothetical protein n=1 Tax=Pedobacter sp. BMA TaxID=1663685 RepID=UPI00064AD0F7|nr:hypothetical protein [Pedobacter sp. BMA]KLT63997.1 hypothetical protein AB669_18190 [Pedobacter sp. BMA]
MRLLICTWIITIFFLASCRKDERITTDPNAMLTFANDSLLFDTLFTTIGSTTKRIKIANPNRSALNIGQIKLSGGTSSSYHLNINGESTNLKQNLIINGGDSINIFVKVTIDPKSTALPFLVQDSIIINYNGNKKALQLLAYGQNAVFINGGTLSGNVNWTNTLPYVISGSPTITKGSQVNVSAGAKIYFHKDATLNVEGVLNVNGSIAAPIMFCSDRLESIYSEQAGQWQGVHLKPSGNALIKNAVIKNASVGITSDSLSQNTNAKLILANTIIKNMQVAAYIGYHSELNAFNCLMYNCGNYILYAVGGGNYNLKQNSFAGYNPDFPRKNAALTFSDYLSANAYNNLQINLTNNIIWGSLSNEIDIQKKSNAVIQSVIMNNLIRTTNAALSTNNNVINTDPQFVSPVSGNFNISITSVAIRKGVDLSGDYYFSTYLNKDINGADRIFPSSLGCYQKY